MLGGLDMFNKLAIGAIIGFGFLTPATAEALSLLSHKPLVSPPSIVENVKFICDEQGRCYHPPIRRPVARCVYGDNNYYVPYAGPGDYDIPRYRHDRRRDWLQG